jgi:integrase
MWDAMRTSHKPLGRHPHHRLTAVSVNAKRSPGRYADGNGLYLLVDPSRAKRWIWRGVIRGKRCDLGLGSVRLVSLAEAREEAIRLRKSARKGGDPVVDRQRESRVIPTFKEAAIKVHASHSATFRNTKHKAQWLASLETDVFPTLGDRPIDTIESGDVLKVLAAVWTVKPETARRLRQRIKVVFDWAKASGLRSGDNPTDGLTKVLPKHQGDKQHHPALPYQAVPRFVSALRSAPDTIAPIRLALELLILTATRDSEVRLARWSEVDLDARVWTIPGVRMKSGREHRIPLSARAVEILEQARTDAEGGRWIFPGHKPGKPLSNMTFLKTARRLTTATITTHGFRSSFRDWSAEKTNAPRAVCEAALAHTLRDKTEAAYNRTDLFDRRRDLMDAWTGFVTTQA